MAARLIEVRCPSPGCHRLFFTVYPDVTGRLVIRCKGCRLDHVIDLAVAVKAAA